MSAPAASVRVVALTRYVRLADVMDATGHTLPTPAARALLASLSAYDYDADPVAIAFEAAGRDLFTVDYGPLELVARAVGSPPPSIDAVWSEPPEAWDVLVEGLSESIAVAARLLKGAWKADAHKKNAKDAPQVRCKLVVNGTVRVEAERDGEKVSGEANAVSPKDAGPEVFEVGVNPAYVMDALAGTDRWARLCFATGKGAEMAPIHVRRAHARDDEPRAVIMPIRL